MSIFNVRTYDSFFISQVDGAHRDRKRDSSKETYHGSGYVTELKLYLFHSFITDSFLIIVYRPVHITHIKERVPKVTRRIDHIIKGSKIVNFKYISLKIKDRYLHPRHDTVLCWYKINKE